MKKQLANSLRQALQQLDLAVPDSIVIERCRQKGHGDFASNIAMVVAKQAQRPPRELADQLVQQLPAIAGVEQIEVAGPGFINFTLQPQAHAAVIADILAAGDDYGSCKQDSQQKINLEYVSANPTGPLHVGHGRSAAYGSSLANILSFAGFDVTQEYYVNDAGRQMAILAVSVWLRYLELLEEPLPFPSNGYRGDYIITIAEQLHTRWDRQFFCQASDVSANLPLDEADGGDKEVYIDALAARARSLLGHDNFALMLDFALQAILQGIKTDLSAFAVYFDLWFSERSLVDANAVTAAVERLQSLGHTYEQDGALWFKSTAFGDDKDRVLVRDNGQATYFASDAAYLLNKFERGFDQAVYILGADHHGYVPRLRALQAAMALSGMQIHIPIVQFAVLYRQGEQVKMSTRSGSFVTLRELYDEVGCDGARFFYVMRKVEQHLDFDLDLAKSQSHENPVYYVQYAHARICSVWHKLTDLGKSFDRDHSLRCLELLASTIEQDLLERLQRFPEVIVGCAAKLEVHSLTFYLRELANAFHSYYNSEQFLVEDNDLLQARLALLQATRQVLQNGLRLLAVSQPQSM